MAWNLVDHLTPAGAARRRFFVPLASIPVGSAIVRAVDRTMYTFSEAATIVGTNTSDLMLQVTIQIPAGGLVAEGAYPDPLIRLHAIDAARIKFEPAAGGMLPRLTYEMLTIGFFRTPLVPAFPKWFDRWVDAETIPEAVICENVDLAHLQALLNQIAAPVDTTHGNRVAATNGLSFPSDVTQANKATFITQFMEGAADTYIYAEAGAVIGTAALAAGSTTHHALRFHARYATDSAATPRPMNPRELFHLLFGNDSNEALTHPLLVQLNSHGLNNQNTVHPESKRMLLRPPLRTWKRVEWEANQEIDNPAHSLTWRPAGSLGARRFYNDHSRVVGGGVVRSFNNGNYATSNKCNLFAADIPLRAGLVACVHPVGANRWHYLDANSYSNNTHQSVGVDPRAETLGAGSDATTRVSWKTETLLRAAAPADRQRLLNEMMQIEGRCFLLAGARPRKFIDHTVVAGVEGVSNCVDSLRTRGIGHIVIVDGVVNQPQFAAGLNHGLQRIQVNTWEASGAGAVRRLFTAQIGGAGGAAAAGTGFIRLHLIELIPAGDPDTLQGLRSLNAETVNRNLLGRVEEAAVNRRMTHDPMGAALPAAPAPGTCCHDNYPANVPPASVGC